MDTDKKIAKTVTLKDIMEVFPYKRTSIYNMRRKGLFPPAAKVEEKSNKLFFYYDDIVDLIESFRQKSLEPQLSTGYDTSKDEVANQNKSLHRKPLELQLPAGYKTSKFDKKNTERK